MREVLFRGKTDNGEWVEGSLVILEKNDCRIVTETDVAWAYTSGSCYDGDMTCVDPSTICQYTGLTDKNGNKIWENDILEWEYENAPSDFFECVWLEDEIGFAFNNCKYRNDYTNAVDCYDEDYTDDFCMKVIGNSFDNPELLKGE